VNGVRHSLIARRAVRARRHTGWVNTIRPDRRDVSARLTLSIGATADIVMAIAVADVAETADESLVVLLDDEPIETKVIRASHGARLHQLRDVEPGWLTVEYHASVLGAADPVPVGEEEWYEYIRPSRYCESDTLGPLARGEFAGLSGFELLDGVSSWVGEQIAYIPGSSRAIDGAVSTMLARSGVCRDFAHLTVALLRANGVPARVVAVYAPGLNPMDFHAVVEAVVDGVWYVVDPTCLAPRSSMLRIATGADAADTAFLTTVAGAVELVYMEVTAIADPFLPSDDMFERVQLG